MNKVQLPLERHPSLPAGMDAEQLAEWLRSSAVEVFTSSKETPLTPEEISGYEKEAVTSGREINRLEDLLAMVREHVKKGSSEKVRLVLPATIGIKNLSSVRRENEDMVERVLQRLECLLSPLPFQFTLPDGDAVPPHLCQLFLFLPVSLLVA